MRSRSEADQVPAMPVRAELESACPVPAMEAHAAALLPADVRTFRARPFRHAARSGKPMNRPIQRPDGRFAGSIGTGATHVPTASAPVPPAPASGSPLVDRTATEIHDLHSRMVAARAASLPPCRHLEFRFQHNDYAPDCDACIRADMACDSRLCLDCGAPC
jgi:hypothetical protein